MFEQGVLSPDGSCRTFDADADGYARGEAINALYVKRLDVALANGDPVRAVIRGTASNCDGKTPGIAHPSSESHEALIRSCYESAGLFDYSQTGFVECHGTGTATGSFISFIHTPFQVNEVHVGGSATLQNSLHVLLQAILSRPQL